MAVVSFRAVQVGTERGRRELGGEGAVYVIPSSDALMGVHRYTECTQVRQSVSHNHDVDKVL